MLDKTFPSAVSVPPSTMSCEVLGTIKYSVPTSSFFSQHKNCIWNHFPVDWKNQKNPSLPVRVKMKDFQDFE